MFLSILFSENSITDIASDLFKKKMKMAVIPP